MLKSEAIKNLLQVRTHPDLAAMYHAGMEVQVNVARCDGERVDKEYKGREYHAWTNGFQEWKSFRIPHNSNSDPVDSDGQITFDLDKYVECIGMTGWDWKAKKSRWVGFDFDSITGHSEKHAKKLEASELESIRTTVRDIPWCTLRASTGGSGLHLYVHIADSPEVANHTEHAALARAILGKLSALTGFDFNAKVDVCGGNLWVSHIKTGPYKPEMPGLRLLKQGEALTEIPPNWRDHIGVKTTPKFVKDNGGNYDEFEELVSKRSITPLDAEHKELVKFLENSNALWWWDNERHMLVCHTADLKAAHTQLGMKGPFETLAKGTERGQDQNAFAFASRNGSWVVRRHTMGVAEADTWEQDGHGYTKCILNQIPDLRTAARIYGGLEHKSGGYVFEEAEMALKAASLLGVNLTIPPKLYTKQAKLKETKDSKLSIDIENSEGHQIQGWWKERKNLSKIVQFRKAPEDNDDIENYDDLIRHLISEQGGDYGWVIKTSGRWVQEPLQHVSHLLAGEGVNANEIKKVIGSSIARCWTVVNQPFQPEYPGDRKWNRDAAQLRFAPTIDKDILHYPTWNKILTHLGKNLNHVVAKDVWCQDNNILTGADYLKVWIATLFQKPYNQLPYLFLFGDQDSGKSILHESIALLMTKGYTSANTAIQSQGNFNGELESAILCYIEEINLAKNDTAYNKIKEWVTCLNMPIHSKHGTPFGVPNTTHWIQISNTPEACPVFKGDSRIVVIGVDGLDPAEKIPKAEMLLALEKEAPDFLGELLRIHIPDSPGRLGLPVLATDEKVAIEHSNRTDLEEFVQEKCHICPGHTILFSEFYDKFAKYMDQPNPMPLPWTKIAVGKALKLIKGVVKGKIRAFHAQTYVGNVSWEPEPVLYPPFEYKPGNSDEIIQMEPHRASAIKVGESGTKSGESSDVSDHLEREGIPAD